MPLRAAKQFTKNVLRSLGYSIIRTPRNEGIASAPPPPAWPEKDYSRMIWFPASSANGDAGGDVPSDGTPAEYAESCYQRGQAAYAAGHADEAFRCYSKTLALIHRHGAAVAAMKALAGDYYAAGRAESASGNTAAAKQFWVRAVECDPANAEIRCELEKLIAAEGKRDLTRHCYIFYDPKRAEAIHREAVLRSLEFVSIAGVPGDIMEFGVLGGWSARIFGETMRDLMNMGNLHLFDSFDGLPDYSSQIDIDSYEIGGRDLWANKMRFPDEFVRELGSPVDVHIKDRLGDVLSGERIQIHRGFYSETLRQPLKAKAALVHVDCDLYQSTVEVLQRLYEMDVFQDGCVLMFDDWNCNKASPNYGERRAFREFLEWQDQYTTSPFFTYGFNGAVFILHDKNA